MKSQKNDCDKLDKEILFLKKMVKIEQNSKWK